MRIAVAGAGIAGLTSAIALAAKGFAVDLYERAAALEEVGAGIQLAPNAMTVLARLEVTEELAGRLSEPEALVIRDARSGAALARVPLGRTARERYDAPYCTMHRADLQACLAGAARAHPLVASHLGAEVRDVRSTETGVDFTAAGESRQADLLIAADGVRSAIRTSFFKHPGPGSLRRSAWRATLPAGSIAGELPLSEVGLWLGAGGHVVHYPIGGGRMLNLVVIAAGETPAPPSEPFAGAVRRIVERVESWHVSHLFAVDASQPWVSGRVALIGDAAHAMAPSAAQGGAQAIEDAWTLAEALQRIPDPEGALHEYARIRSPRVRRVARASAHNLKLYEWKGVPAILRNTALSILPAKLLLSRLDWLFRFPRQ